jgi:hypothetical protein
METLNFERAIQAGLFGMAFGIFGFVSSIFVFFTGYLMSYSMMLSIGLCSSTFFLVMFIVSTFVAVFSLSYDLYEIYKIGKMEVKRINESN